MGTDAKGQGRSTQAATSRIQPLRSSQLGAAESCRPSNGINTCGCLCEPRWTPVEYYPRLWHNMEKRMLFNKRMQGELWFRWKPYLTDVFWHSASGHPVQTIIRSWASFWYRGFFCSSLKKLVSVVRIHWRKQEISPWRQGPRKLKNLWSNESLWSTSWNSVN